MTTFNLTPRNGGLTNEIGTSQESINNSNSPLLTERHKEMYNLSMNREGSINYYLKLFFFTLIVLSTVLSMAQTQLPEKRKTAFFPNVSKISSYVEYTENAAIITVDKLNDIKPGDKIRVLTADKADPFDAIVSSVRGDCFTIEGLSKEKYGEKVYVYGKEVNDFRTVDYDALSVMNYSATQKLNKQLDEQKTQIVSLQNEISSLKSTMEKMVLLLQEQNLQLTTLKASQVKEVNSPKAEEINTIDPKSSGFIPNIFKKASSVEYASNSIVIVIDKLEDLRPGDKIRVYNEKNESCETVVSTVNGDCITVEKLSKEQFGENIFVYGKQVNMYESAGL